MKRADDSDLLNEAEHIAAGADAAAQYAAACRIVQAFPELAATPSQVLERLHAIGARPYLRSEDDA